MAPRLREDRLHLGVVVVGDLGDDSVGSVIVFPKVIRVNRRRLHKDAKKCHKIEKLNFATLFRVSWRPLAYPVLRLEVVAECADGVQEGRE